MTANIDTDIRGIADKGTPKYDSSSTAKRKR